MLSSISISRRSTMKILGEDLSGIGRWYIAIPPVLLIGFLIGLFFLASAGQTRLNAANERVHATQLRQQALIEFAALVTNAESPVPFYRSDQSAAQARWQSTPPASSPLPASFETPDTKRCPIEGVSLEA